MTSAMSRTNLLEDTDYYSASAAHAPIEREKPRVLLMGLRKSGKSSIQKVVFHKISPNETLFLEMTNKVMKDDISQSSFVNFQIWDFPGQIDFLDAAFDSESIFCGCSALVFVIDSQADYMPALAKLHETICHAYRVNPNIFFEIFIHKVDGLSDDSKIETTRDIHQRVTEELVHAGLEEVHVSFYLTSIYDHTIFESFSKVVQKLIKELPSLENLLNILNSSSGFEKSFLFAVSCKIYIATDSAPVDVQSYELCSDMIEVVRDVADIYGPGEQASASADGAPAAAAASNASSIIRLNNGLVLCLKGVTDELALVCILRQEHFVKQGIIEFNFHCFRETIQKLFKLKPTGAPKRM